MRTLTSKRYTLIGFNDNADYPGWVFTEHSPVAAGDDATLIVDEAKFVSDGVVYYLCKNGTYNVNGKSYNCVGGRTPAYMYVTE